MLLIGQGNEWKEKFSPEAALKCRRAVIADRTFLFPRLPTNSFIGFHNGNIKGKIERIQNISGRPPP